MTTDQPDTTELDLDAIAEWNAEIQRSIDAYNDGCPQCKARKREALRTLCWTCRHANYRARA